MTPAEIITAAKRWRAGGYVNRHEMDAIKDAATLNLLPLAGGETERSTPLDEERASFQREALERHDRGEVP